jgi:hypothetical protein
MYLSRVAASAAGMSSRSKLASPRATALPPFSDMDVSTPQYVRDSGAIVPDPQWAWGCSACLDLSIPAFMSVCEESCFDCFAYLAWGAH